MDSFPFNYTSSAGEKVRGIRGEERALAQGKRKKPVGLLLLIYMRGPGAKSEERGGWVEGEGCVGRGVLHGTHDDISL